MQSTDLAASQGNCSSSTAEQGSDDRDKGSNTSQSRDGSADGTVIAIVVTFKLDLHGTLLGGLVCAARVRDIGYHDLVKGGHRQMAILKAMLALL